MNWRLAILVLPLALVTSGLVTWGVFRLFGHRPVHAAPKDEVPPKTTAPVAAPTPDQFTTQIKPLLVKYCETCHNEKKQSAGISFELYKDTSSARKVKDLWEKTKELVETKQMPPKKQMQQPTDAERKLIVTWIDDVATKIDCGLARDPGRPTIRRLNRNEYNNTIRDLMKVNFKPADDFPSDDVGYGFDNIGDVLSMPPILLEKYLSAADKILDAAIVVQKPVVSSKERFNPQNVRVFPPSAKMQDRRLIQFTSSGSAVISYDFVHEGEYIFRVKAYGEKVGTEFPKLGFDLNRVSVKNVTVEAVQGKSQMYEARTKATAGRKDVAFVFTNPFTDDKKKARSLSIEYMEIEGPFNPVAKPLPESHQAIFGTGTAKDRAAGQKILQAFADKAYRRPTKPEEVARLMKLYDVAASQNEPFEQCVKFALKGVLVSPHFLFRIERDAEPNNPAAIHPISEHELATRLSYFLWASMPDDTLRTLADKGELRKPGVLEAQVKRMLLDPKASALVENFAGQWLMLRTLATLTPDRTTYRNFDNSLRDAMIRETELYFEHVMREDRSVIEFLDSNYTFVNERLARHYGINGVTGSQFKKVTLTDANRGGLVTQASILTVTSNPTRTSPVKRGKWILENILGTPPPPPPPDVPELANDSKAASTGSLRQRMEEHRKNPACATCHAKMDPLGFGLENFDGVGGYRTFDGKFKIEPSGELPDGAKFSGPADLRKVLLTKSDFFRRNLSEKMLTYALGRGMEYYDKCAIDDVVQALKNNNDKFSAMIIAIVKNDTFQKRRGMATK